MRSPTVVAFMFGAIAASPVAAQIVPDTSLLENAIVAPNGSTFVIDGGTTAGTNLFHSFSEFSVPTGTEAFFNNATSIDNIITRVTGGNISNIDGLIRASGSANLFLLNPNGIVFGENAQLAIGGSFFGSTAESLQFSDGVEFSSVAPDANPILTVSVPVGLQFASTPLSERGAIAVNNTGISDIVPTDNFGLSVNPGQILALVGTNVNFSGGIVTAPSGRIEMGSVVDGEVDIIATPVGIELNYDNVNEFGNIQLSNRSSLFSPAVFDNPNSAIALYGSNISLNGSQIVSLTNGNVSSGDITINATGSLDLGGTIAAFPFSSWIVNQVAPGAAGNSGEIRVSAPQLSIGNGARIQTLSFGAGAAGNVTVNVPESIRLVGFAFPPDLSLDPSAIDPQTFLEQNTNSRISSENFASGAGGNVSVSAGEMTFLAGGQIATLAGSHSGANGGNVSVVAETITAENAVLFNPLVPSGIASYTLGTGEGGSLDLSAPQFNLFDGAFIVSWTQGSGRGGDVIVNATDSIIGRGINPAFPFADSGITSIALGAGFGGNIDVSTQQINLSEGARIGSVTLIEVGGISVAEGGTGNGGNVTIDADTIELTGTSPLAPDNLTVVSSLSFSSADAGNVSISTRQLRVLDGANLNTASLFSISSLGEALPGSGTGNTGNLTVNASELIEISGVNSLILSSRSFIGTNNLALGNSGELIVNTPRLILQDGGFLGTFASTGGNAGRVTINASDIFISGISAVGLPSFLSANALATNEDFQQAFFTSQIPTGNTGDLTVNASRLTIANGGEVSVEHQGTGNAGRLQINVESLNLDSGGRINATTAFGFGGDIEINVSDSLQLRNGSQINVEALGNIGDGGNLAINSDTIVALENSDIIANAVGGNGGNIDITTQAIFGAEFRPRLTPQSDITASSELGVEGTVRLNTPDVDSTSGLFDLETETIDASAIAFDSCRDYAGSAFYYTGNGGIPENPRQFLEIQMTVDDLGELEPLQGDRGEETSQLPMTHSQLPREATSWTIAPDGKISLVSQVPTTATLPRPECN